MVQQMLHFISYMVPCLSFIVVILVLSRHTMHQFSCLIYRQLSYMVIRTLTFFSVFALLSHSVVVQVRIFSGANVRLELQESLRDYIQATVGTNDRGKLLVPKLVQSYAKGAVEDSLLADWICHHLAPDQAVVIRDSSSQRKQRLLGVRSFTVLAFDSKFRYLFLPDSSGSHSLKLETKQSYKLPEPCSE